jgi:hypothetical protein
MIWSTWQSATTTDFGSIMTKDIHEQCEGKIQGLSDFIKAISCGDGTDNEENFKNNTSKFMCFLILHGSKVHGHFLATGHCHVCPWSPTIVPEHSIGVGTNPT